MGHLATWNLVSAHKLTIFRIIIIHELIRESNTRMDALVCMDISGDAHLHNTKEGGIDTRASIAPTLAGLFASTSAMLVS